MHKNHIISVSCIHIITWSIQDNNAKKSCHEEYQCENSAKITWYNRKAWYNYAIYHEMIIYHINERYQWGSIREYQRYDSWFIKILLNKFTIKIHIIHNKANWCTIITQDIQGKEILLLWNIWYQGSWFIWKDIAQRATWNILIQITF